MRSTLCSMGSVGLVVYWRCNCFVKTVPFGLKDHHTVKTVSNGEDVDYSIMHPTQSLRLYRSQAFPSVLSPSRNLLCLLTIWAFTFSANCANSFIFAQLKQMKKKKKSIVFTKLLFLLDWLSTSLFPFFANHYTCGKVNNSWIQSINQFANSRKDCLFAMCNFFHRGSIHILTALLYIWLLLIYGSFFPLTLYSQALFLTHSENR